jgi:hypothetical protein
MEAIGTGSLELVRLGQVFGGRPWLRAGPGKAPLGVQVQPRLHTSTRPATGYPRGSWHETRSGGTPRETTCKYPPPPKSPPPTKHPTKSLANAPHEKYLCNHPEHHTQNSHETPREITSKYSPRKSTTKHRTKSLTHTPHNPPPTKHHPRSPALLIFVQTCKSACPPLQLTQQLGKLCKPSNITQWI